MSWAASLLGAIMMLIRGVAGTEDKGSCRFRRACHPTGDLRPFLPTPHPSHPSPENIYEKALEQFRGLTPILEKHGNKRADIFNMSLRLSVLNILPRWNQALDLTLVPNKLSTSSGWWWQGLE